MIYYIDPFILWIVYNYLIFLCFGGVGGYWLWPLSDWDPLFD